MPRRSLILASAVLAAGAVSTPALAGAATRRSACPQTGVSIFTPACGPLVTSKTAILSGCPLLLVACLVFTVRNRHATALMRLQPPELLVQDVEIDAGH